MKRRDLLGYLTAALSGAALRANSTHAQSDRSAVSPEALAAEFGNDIDPYFLDAGVLTESEESALVDLERIQEKQMNGEPAVIPRGLFNKRSPTYRFVHWTGDIGDLNGRFVNPLSVTPALDALPVYRLNAQILGFHGSRKSWGSKTNEGTLTVELRASVAGEPVTWLYAQPFDIDKYGASNIGFEYIAQRQGSPEPVFTDQPNIGLRIQLMRQPKKSGRAIRKIIGLTLAVSGVPVNLGNSDMENTFQNIQPMRIPAMLQEGAALSQAVIGQESKEAPIWRSGFNSYGVATGGSRLALTPGFWMVIDGDSEVDLRGVRLEDVGGSVGPTRDGELLDANFLILLFEIGEGSFPRYLQGGGGGSETKKREAEVLEKGVAPEEP